MGLIDKSYLVTLNQRVQGSSPCAPTNQTVEIPRRNLCGAVLQAFTVRRKVPKRFQRLRAKPERAPQVSAHGQRSARHVWVKPGNRPSSFGRINRSS